jgi:hypothetical protein
MSTSRPGRSKAAGLRVIAGFAFEKVTVFLNFTASRVRGRVRLHAAGYIGRQNGRRRQAL